VESVTNHGAGQAAVDEGEGEHDDRKAEKLSPEQPFIEDGRIVASQSSFGIAAYHRTRGPSPRFLLRNFSDA
jgi:hypothetical protein